MDEFEVIGGRQLYQWDTDRSIEVRLCDGETVNEVHYAHAEDDIAPVVKVQDYDGRMFADIPNILLQRFGTLKVWAVVYTEDGRQTLRNAYLSVRARAKPDDYVYTETEIMDYRKVAEDLAELVQRVEEIEENGVQGGGAVASVNGKTGEVYLNAADVGALPTTGGKLTGNLTVPRLISTAADADGNIYEVQLYPTANGGLYMPLRHNGAVANAISMSQSATTFGKPVAISSGGHGGKNAAEGRQNLSLYSKEEIDEKITNTQKEIERLTEEKIDKGSPIAHQQLVTDIEGNTVWEEKLAYDAQCFEWDGNEEGREIYKGAMADSYVFISDVVPSITELNQRCVLTINKKGTETIETITGDDIVEAISGMTVVDTRVYILTEDGINAIRDGQMQSYWPFTKPGIWFMWDTAGNSWPSKFEYGNSKTIDPKYLPKAVAVADAAGDTPTAAEFNALLTALRNAGYLST